MSWIPLHVHSQYSILDSSASIKALVSKALEFKLSALALTDHGNLFGAIEFYKECRNYSIKPIIGCEFYVAPHSRHEKRKVFGQPVAKNLVFIAKNKEGYHNLCKLSSLGYLEGFYYYPRIDKELIKKHSAGLVCLSGGVNGIISNLILGGNQEELKNEILWYQEIFGSDYYFEMQRHQMSEEHLQEDGFYKETWLLQNYQEFIEKQESVNKRIIELSQEFGIKIVAANDSHYINRKDWRAHEILLNVQSGEPCEIWEKDSLGNNKGKIPNPKRSVYPSHEIYFKSPEQIKELFQDLPLSLEITEEISEKCSLEIDFKSKFYPVFWPPGCDPAKDKEKRVEAVGEFLWKLCYEGISKRYTEERLDKLREVYPDQDPITLINERLDYEMNLIISKGLADYLLIVYDFINWAKKNGMPVGPGRGSGAGSIILYLIGITDIEPLRFHLFFERFINPERLSYPDIDVDICMESRGKVIEYTTEKYGKENVVQIITFGTMKAKMAVKDVGRVLSVPLPKVNEIVKYIPDDLNITLSKALEVDVDLQRLYQEDEEVKSVLDNAQNLEGSIRNTGIHAAGVIICGDPIVSHIPICVAKDAEMAVSQFSMKPVESVGMLKVDVLGLKTLTSIRRAIEEIKENHGVFIDWVNLPLDDAKTFNLLNQGKTLGVFQLESSGMQDLARQLHLDKFEEIIAVVSLYRPGPMDMIPSYVSRKHGTEKIEYDHPWLEEILSETYGIMVYQEQVMQIAQKLASYSLGEGDVLRRAMGKKDMDQMAKERAKFNAGAIGNGVSEEVAGKIFDKMEKFAAYGFNKSHAAAYGFLSYVTAYLKAHYPKEWMAALMSCDKDDLSKVAKFIGECQTMGISILPPDVNEARERFTATESGIRFGLAGIKGVGEGIVDVIIKERLNKGKFIDFYDFFKRIDVKKVGKKVIELLVLSGGFDFSSWSRDAMIQSVEPMYNTILKKQKDEAKGALSFFSLMDKGEEDKKFMEEPALITSTPKRTLLAKERELLGFYLTGHPMEEFKELLKRLSCINLEKLKEISDSVVVRSAFIVDTVITRISRMQKKFAIITISDGMEKLELPIWPDLYEEKGYLLEENQFLYAVLQKEIKQGEEKISCRWFGDLSQCDESMIETCDQAFDRAKLQMERFSHQKKQKDTHPKVDKRQPGAKQVTKKITKPLCIKVDIQKVQMSHILQIKEKFREYSGDQAVDIQFVNGNDQVALIEIPTQWGIKKSEDFKRSLKEIASLI